MYINPFFAGVLATVCVEVLCSFIYALQHNEKDKMKLIELTPDEMEKMIKKLMEVSDGENNDNQGE